jgi:hypothetical protein
MLEFWGSLHRSSCPRIPRPAGDADELSLVASFDCGKDPRIPPLGSDGTIEDNQAGGELVPGAIRLGCHHAGICAMGGCHEWGSSWSQGLLSGANVLLLSEGEVGQVADWGNQPDGRN